MDRTRSTDERYLGDGVYASYDGYNVWLDTRAQEPIQQIALEPDVLVALDAFRAHVLTGRIGVSERPA